MTLLSHPVSCKLTVTGRPFTALLSHREMQSFVIIALSDFIPEQIAHVGNLSRKTSVLNYAECFHYPSLSPRTADSAGHLIYSRKLLTNHLFI